MQAAIPLRRATRPARCLVILPGVGGWASSCCGHYGHASTQSSSSFRRLASTPQSVPQRPGRNAASRVRYRSIALILRSHPWTGRRWAECLWPTNRPARRPGLSDPGQPRGMTSASRSSVMPRLQPVRPQFDRWTMPGCGLTRRRRANPRPTTPAIIEAILVGSGTAVAAARTMSNPYGLTGILTSWTQKA